MRKWRVESWNKRQARRSITRNSTAWPSSRKESQSASRGCLPYPYNSLKIDPADGSFLENAILSIFRRLREKFRSTTNNCVSSSVNVVESETGSEAIASSSRDDAKWNGWQDGHGIAPLTNSVNEFVQEPITYMARRNWLGIWWV